MPNNTYLAKNKKLTYFFALLLAVAIIFTALIIPKGPAEEVDAWSNYTSKPTQTTTSGGVEYIAISKPEELAYISKNISSYKSSKIMLVSNIDLSAHNWVPISGFSGVFDGVGCVITGLKVTERQYAGLFGKVSGATLTRVSISGASVIGNNYAGIVVAYAENSTTIEKCLVSSSTITINYSTSYTDFKCGGVVGALISSSITQCLGESNNVYGKNQTNTNTAYFDVGGIVGYTNVGTVSYCGNYKSGAVSTNYNQPYSACTGGVVGSANGGGSISCCYNTVPVTGGTSSSYQSYTGGIAGKAGNVPISDSYNDATVNSYAKEQTWGRVNDPYSGTVQFSVLVISPGPYTTYMYFISANNTSYVGKSEYMDGSSPAQQSFYYTIGRKVYRGGICGYTESTITSVYNWGSLGGDSAVHKKYYEMYYRILNKDNSGFSATDGNGVGSTPFSGDDSTSVSPSTQVAAFLLRDKITYDCDVVSGNIVGATSSTISKAFYNSSYKITHSYGINAHRGLYDYYEGIDGTQGEFTITSWTSNSVNGPNDMKNYNKYYLKAASNKSKIEFVAEGAVSYGSSDRTTTTIFTITTGLSSSYSPKGTEKTSVTASDLGSNWTTSSDRNSGRPFIKGFYWDKV